MLHCYLILIYFLCIPVFAADAAAVNPKVLKSPNPKSYFKVPKDVKNNSTHFDYEDPKNLQQIVINHSSDINTKDFIEIYRKCTQKPYSVLVIDTTLPSNNSLKFKKNLQLTNDDYQRSNQR